jgi:uncharacterized protein (DUF4415 family)
MKAKLGDKVRLKLNRMAGARGIVEEAQGNKLVVRLEGSERKVHVVTEQVTNLSEAARKAWVNMPNRQVGRPKGLRLCDRTSVTLRIDRDLWKRFRDKESIGAIKNRTATVNEWLRDKLSELDRVGPRD